MPDSHDCDSEPQEVRDARATIRTWELRNGHSVYVHCIDGGHVGYQAKCWDCDWVGPERLRGDEPMGTPESRAHKQNAQNDMGRHAQDTRPDSAALREELKDR